MVRSIAEAIVIKDENLFCITDRDGTIPLKGDHGFGLYYNDCRYLNGYSLRLGTSRPTVLVSNTSQEFSSVFQMSNEEFTGLDGELVRKEQLGIQWRRIISGKSLTMGDSITIQNYGLEPVRFEITLNFEGGFEDVFVVRGLMRESSNERTVDCVSDRRLVFIHEGKDGYFRSLCIEMNPAPKKIADRTAHYEISLGAKETKKILVTILARESKTRASFEKGCCEMDPKVVETTIERNFGTWLTQEAKVESDSLSLNRTILHSFRDLRALESRHNGHTFFAAGIPWFATLFGRDSLITAIQTLAYNPRIAEETLRLLATYQGKEVNAWRDEAPGKILHELRMGELARAGEIPHTPYYGTVDATPLFLVLVGRHAHWTGRLDLFRELEEVVEKALGWMREYGDISKNGYLEYAGESERGLFNQGWKDSWDGIVNADGSICSPPIALVEVQGYVYEAKHGIADLYRRSGNEARARELQREAEALRERFNRDFWMDEKKCYALALQKDGKRAEVIASNPGHALWSGIADVGKAAQVRDRLMQDDMFNGWGIRTFSKNELRYNPLGYHLGTVWPHDNSLIAAGFRRYGFERAALQVFSGIFRASVFFERHRLPELFAGFSERDYGVPVHYPVACHPQAWAAATIPHLIETLLGLQPDGFSSRLRIIRPLLPDFVDRLEFRGLRVGEASIDLGFYRTARNSIAVEVLRLEGALEVVVQPGVNG